MNTSLNCSVLQAMMRCACIFLVLLMACSCSRNAEQRKIVSAMSGKEVLMPDGLACTILGDTIDFSLDDADYTIVAYIDSAGCTACRMKLAVWDGIINELKSLDDADVNFVMVINASDAEEVDYLLKRDNFLHPVCIDPDGRFAELNGLPADMAYHNFLLDSNNEIVLVGNPAINPKIMDLYRKVILGEAEHNAFAGATIAVGAVHACDTIVKQFEVSSLDMPLLTVQGIVPSCDCVSASISADTIKLGNSALLTVTYVADSVPGPVTRHIDVFFNEKENPERYTLHGYVINN